MSTRQLPLQQHPNFSAAVSLLGRRTREIDLEGAAPVQTIVRFGVRFASRGPVWAEAPETTKASALRRTGLHLVNSNGGDGSLLREAAFRQISPSRKVAELPLAGTPEDRVRRLKGNWRSALRRGENAPQIIQREVFDPRRHRWLLEADLKQQRAKGYRSLPHRFVLAYATANTGSVFVMVAYSGGEPISAMLFLVHGAVATYHLGWTGTEGRRNSSHHVILMRAAEYLASQGVMCMDLGAVDTDKAPGLARFKIGTGASVRTLGGTWLRLPIW